MKQSIRVGLSMLLSLVVSLSGWTQWSYWGSDIYNTNPGNVGIGLHTPGARLHVFGSLNNKTAAIIAVNYQGGHYYRSPSEWPAGWFGGLTTWDVLCMSLKCHQLLVDVGIESQQVVARSSIQAPQLTATSRVQTPQLIANSSVQAPIVTATSSVRTPLLIVDNNLGVGTDAPAARLHVRGTSANRSVAIIAAQSSGGAFHHRTDWPSGWFGGLSTWDILCQSIRCHQLISDTNVGIGTGTEPLTHRLDVNGRMRVRGDTTSTNTAGIWLSNATDNRAFVGLRDMNTVGFWGTTAGWQLAMNVVSGNVGVGGMPASNAKFVVHGVARVNVLEIAGADLAEKFPTTDTPEPGMVVEIDPDQPGHLRKASSAYSKRVAGVVAGANGLSKGIVLGNLEGSENHIPVAVSGRVWVYADASERPIEPGDFLTTAHRPGYAMAVADPVKAQGAIIGKAMTRLEYGKTGMVLVLVSLQ